MDAAHGVISSQTTDRVKLIFRAGTDIFRFAERPADRSGISALFAEYRLPFVIYLAPQAGVRHSSVDPRLCG